MSASKSSPPEKNTLKKDIPFSPQLRQYEDCSERMYFGLSFAGVRLLHGYLVESGGRARRGD